MIAAIFWRFNTNSEKIWKYIYFDRFNCQKIPFILTDEIGIETIFDVQNLKMLPKKSCSNFLTFLGHSSIEISKIIKLHQIWQL